MRRSSLARIAPLLLLGILPCWLLASFPTGPSGDAAEASSKKKIEQWIEDLGSDRFEAREKATHGLIDLEIEPLALRQALKSSDAEVRRRVTLILETHVQKRARRGLAKAQVLAREGRIDEMIERLVYWKDRDPEDEGSKAVAELAARLIEWEHRTFGKTRLLSKDFPIPIVGHPVHNPITPKELAEMWTRSTHLRGNEISLSKREVTHFNAVVIIASEDVRVPGVYCGVIVAEGNIRMQYGPRDSVIICDGDFEARGLAGCLVIAHGKVTCHGNVAGCTILSESTVEFSKSVTAQQTAIRSASTIEFSKGATIQNTTILNGETPKVVKFFDPATVGLTVWQLYQGDRPRPDGSQIVDDNGRPLLGGGIWIKEVRKGTPFAAGLRAGDIVTAIDKAKTPSKEIFRKVLRRKLAEGGPTITFTVRRAKETLDVSIPIKD